MGILCFTLGVPILPGRIGDFQRNTTRCSLSAVAGATGGVGRLLVKELCDANIPVRALVRDENLARESLPEQVALSKVVSLYTEASVPDIKEGLRDVETLYICVGTTAYPTKRWFRGDTPQKADIDGVRNLLECTDKNSLKRVVYASSIGTLRSKSFPFAILNLFGILDAKRTAEDIVKACGTSYAIVRLGKLTETPINKPAIFLPGDVGSGDLSRALAARVLRFCGEVEHNVEFCVMEADDNTTSVSYKADEVLAGLTSLST